MTATESKDNAITDAIREATETRQIYRFDLAGLLKKGGMQIKLSFQNGGLRGKASRLKEERGVEGRTGSLLKVCLARN